jgi:sarcosine oxidase
MGSSAAWWLARRGHRVTVYEQFGPGHTRGSSHGGSRIFRFAYPDRRYVEMAREALPLWRELEADAGETLLDTTGSIDHGDPTSVGAVADALDGDCEWMPADAARLRWSGFRFDTPVLFQRDGGRCRADATVAALQRRAQDLGAVFHFDTPVEDVAPLAADVVVVTAGAWTSKVGNIGLALPPLTVTQEQVFHFAPRDPSAVWPSFIHHGERFIYGLETPGEGVKVAEHHTGAVVDPDRRDFVVDPVVRERVVAYVREWMPGLDPAPVNETTCLYTTTPDESFVIERVGNVVVGSACSGHGFKFTPLVGRLLADLAALAAP